MEFKTFVRYYRLSVFDKKLPEILCANDAEHMSLVPATDEYDNIWLECYACGYTLRPGLEMYNRIKKQVGEFDGESTGY